MIGIYKITSPSGKVYIGQSWDIQDRWTSCYFCYDCKTQTKIYHSLLKYRVENHKFEVLRLFTDDISQEQMDFFEQAYAGIEIAEGKDLLNIRRPGSRGKHSEETKQKMRIVARNRINPPRGPRPQEVKDKIRATLTGVKHTEERCKMMGEKRKGKPSPNKGKKYSEEKRIIVSEKRKQNKLK